jgi:hypothetical protein
MLFQYVTEIYNFVGKITYIIEPVHRYKAIVITQKAEQLLFKVFHSRGQKFSEIIK